MSTPPAAWYPSPDDDLLQRWWNGTAWTSMTRPDPETVAVPTQRTDTVQPYGSDEASPTDDREKAVAALDAMQQQGGLVGVFAAVAADLIESQTPPPTPTGPGVQPYGRPAFENPFGTSAGDAASTGGLSWRVGPFTGGPDPDDRHAGRRRRSKPMGPVGQLVFGLVVLLIGLVVATSITSENLTHSDESTVSGTVVDHRTWVDDDGSSMCSPVASFSVGGSTYRAGTSISTQSCPAMGSAVTVIYTTVHPGDGDARIKSTSPFIWLIPLGGLLLAGFAVRGLVRSRRYTSL